MKKAQKAVAEAEGEREYEAISEAEASWALVWFEDDVGSDAAKNAQLANFHLPLCLARLGPFDYAKSKDPKLRIPIKQWYFAERYDAPWRRWLIAPPGKAAKGGVYWGGGKDDWIERRSIRLTGIEFVQSSKQDSMKFAAPTKKVLRSTAGSRYAEFSGKSSQMASKASGKRRR